MNPERRFVGWNTVSLDAVVDHLWGMGRSGPFWDLSSLVMVTSGARAGRRLVELLVIRAGREEGAGRVTLLPPRVTTVGHLPELLYLPDKPIAGDLPALMAWVKALRNADKSVLDPLIGQAPDPADIPAWIAVARDLAGQREQVTREGVTPAAVAEACETMEGFKDTARWNALAKVEAGYLAALAEAGMDDRDAARSAMVAGSAGVWLDADKPLTILLVGVLEMPRLVERIVLAYPGKVTSLVFAPASDADGFTEMGLIVPKHWTSRHVDLEPDQIIIAESPLDQAAAVVAALARANGEHSPGQVVVGVGDDAMQPTVERTLAAAGVAARSSLGRPVDRTGPAQLLRSIGAFVASSRPADAAALLRHPDIHGVVFGAAGALSQFDRYLTEHVPTTISNDLPERISAAAAVTTDPGDGLGAVGGGNDDADDVLIEADQDEQGNRTFSYLSAIPRICAALVKLADTYVGQRKLSEWAEILLKTLHKCYGEMEMSTDNPNDRVLVRAAGEIAEGIKALRALPPGLDGEVAASQAISLVLSSVRSARVPEVDEGPAVELVGWLELHMDDCPVKVVVGLNEGIIPSSSRVDPVLPDSLRQRLELPDSASQYARDVCILATLAAGCTTLALVSGKTTADGEPMTPSRLLFQCDDATIAQRAQAFFGAPARQWQPVAVEPKPGEVLIPYPRTTGTLVNARGEEVSLPLQQMHVTAFRDYIKDPYRFYLKQVLKLRTEDDIAVELQASTFGTLAHSVLAAFGKSDLRDSSDAVAIAAFLEEELEKQARYQFGSTRGTALVIQLGRLKRRMGAFAQAQAKEAQAGWTIDKVEHEFEFDLDMRQGEPPFRVIGKIDRIDVLKDDAGTVTAVRVVDYKTGEGATKPGPAHYSAAKGWTDLQLPLYSFWAREHYGVDGIQVTMAYFLLPSEVEGTGVQLADWDAAALDGAWDAAAEVAGKVRACVFWPPAEPDRRRSFRDGLEGIALDEAAGRAHLIDRSAAAAGGSN